jgi:hypothetical protein
MAVDKSMTLKEAVSRIPCSMCFRYRERGDDDVSGKRNDFRVEDGP